MSKKLSGNGLWESSRMMLPEHKERLISHRKEGNERAVPAARNNVPTQEEIKLIRDFALLPFILSIIETNRRQIENTTYSLRKLYLASAQLLLDKVHEDLTQVRKTLRERNIKVHEEERIDDSIQYRFHCRGYEDRFIIMRDLVRAEASVRISRYIAAIFSK